MDEVPGTMDTMSEATERLRSAGYIESWSAEAGKLRCAECATGHDPEHLTVDQVIRFEGASDPGDEAILFALTGPCGHRGQYASAYGPDTPVEDVAIIHALGDARSRMGGQS